METMKQQYRTKKGAILLTDDPLYWPTIGAVTECIQQQHREQPLLSEWWLPLLILLFLLLWQTHAHRHTHKQTHVSCMAVCNNVCIMIGTTAAVLKIWTEVVFPLLCRYILKKGWCHMWWWWCIKFKFKWSSQQKRRIASSSSKCVWWNI